MASPLQNHATLSKFSATFILLPALLIISYPSSIFAEGHWPSVEILGIATLLSSVIFGQLYIYGNIKFRSVIFSIFVTFGEINDDYYGNNDSNIYIAYYYNNDSNIFSSILITKTEKSSIFDFYCISQTKKEEFCNSFTYTGLRALLWRRWVFNFVGVKLPICWPKRINAGSAFSLPNIEGTKKFTF